jgi:hypothetical protein
MKTTKALVRIACISAESRAEHHRMQVQSVSFTITCSKYHHYYNFTDWVRPSAYSDPKYNSEDLISNTLKISLISD